MPDNKNHYIKPELAITLHGLFLERVKRTPDAVAYRYFDIHLEAWFSLTWQQTLEQVARWQAALLQENLAAGDRVGIMLRNCPQWVMFEQAAMSLGLVVVPLYVVDRPDNIAYIINDAQVKVFLLETDEQWQELRTVIGSLVVFSVLSALKMLTEMESSGCGAPMIGFHRRQRYNPSVINARAKSWPQLCTPPAPPANPRG